MQVRDDAACDEPSSHLLSDRVTALALVAIAALSALLGSWQIGRAGFGNTFYAAAVRSMLDNWHAFFFASFDPQGFVSVDKPPLGLWIQTASAAVFGFHGWSLMLPEIAAGVGSVLLVFALVRRPFGNGAALLAALFMALTPINVAVDRNNTQDSLLLFVLLLAAWAVVQATRHGSPLWLATGMLLVGLGFNIKMMQAWLVLPALGLTYLLFASIPVLRRIGHLILAGQVMLVVSFAWAVAVMLTPAAQRPYVGSSDNNSVFNLIFGYNGLSRLLPQGWSIFGLRNPLLKANVPSATGVDNAFEVGNKGALRLFNGLLGGQISWLLPLALIGLVAAVLWAPWRREREARAGLLLWAGWLVPQIAFFSVAGYYHRYYLTMLSPAIAALAAVGCVALWNHYRHARWGDIALPLALAATAAVQVTFLHGFPDWQARLAPIIVGLAVVAAIALLAGRAIRRVSWRDPRVTTAAAIAGVAALLIGPFAWSTLTLSAPLNPALPFAGPVESPATAHTSTPASRASTVKLLATRHGHPTVKAAQPAGPTGGQQALLIYLTTHQGTTTYLVAVDSGMEAAPLILQANKPVMAMGGFIGRDRILTVDELRAMIANNTVRYVLLRGSVSGSLGGLADGQNGLHVSPIAGHGHLRSGVAGINQWVQENCWVVNPPGYSIPAGRSVGGPREVLYDCAGATIDDQRGI